MQKIVLLKETQLERSSAEPLVFSNETADLIQFDITPFQKDLLDRLEKSELEKEFSKEFLDLLNEADEICYATHQPFELETTEETVESVENEFLRENCGCETFHSSMDSSEDFYEEISTTVGEKIRYDSMGFLIAFLPWIIFWLEPFSSLKVTMLFSLILSTVILIGRKVKKKNNWFDFCSFLFFSVMYPAYRLQPMWVTYLCGFLSSVYLALIWLMTLLVGKPITSEYTRIKSNDTAHFIKSNENLTLMWIVNFLVQGVLFFFHAKNLSYLLILIPSIFVTLIYYQKHREKKKERKIHPLAR